MGGLRWYSRFRSKPEEARGELPRRRNRAGRELRRTYESSRREKFSLSAAHRVELRIVQRPVRCWHWQLAVAGSLMEGAVGTARFHFHLTRRSALSRDRKEGIIITTTNGTRTRSRAMKPGGGPSGVCQQPLIERLDYYLLVLNGGSRQASPEVHTNWYEGSKWADV